MRENVHLIHSVYLTIINMSIAQVVFPQSEKLACIKPTYKGKCDQNDLSSYRSISNLSYLSKLIETTIEKQLWAHLKDVNVIPGNQSAYRENHSTETTVCSIMNDMVQMVSEGKCGILVMLDPRWNKRGGLTQPSVFVFKRPVTSLGWQTPPLALGYLLLLVIFGWFSY